jgi:hypothetical protein
MLDFLASGQEVPEDHRKVPLVLQALSGEERDVGVRRRMQRVLGVSDPLGEPVAAKPCRPVAPTPCRGVRPRLRADRRTATTLEGVLELFRQPLRTGEDRGEIGLGRLQLLY